MRPENLMSDFIKHECGIALVRLLKPLQFYIDKYETPMYGLNKLYLLMEKQHNRGQDGAGVVTITLDKAPGSRYISRRRSVSKQPIADIFRKIAKNFEQAKKKHPEKLTGAEWVRENVAYSGELLLGHLRYGTHGVNNIEACHPFLRQNNWMTRNLVLAGNFNLTNVEELVHQLVEIGQHPKEKSDTVTVLEKIGHFLDVENQRLFDLFKAEGHSHQKISQLIAKHIDIQRVLQRSAQDFDGGYTMAGLFGHGDAFVMRDPSGIRPAFYYVDEEVAVVSSERPALQTCFDVRHSEIKEVQPGHALIIKTNGEVSEKQIQEPREKLSCSFERIYFSRGTDRDIYCERKKLGYLLHEKVNRAIDGDYKNTVFSFVPNTAEVAFYGLVEAVHEHITLQKAKDISKTKFNGNSDTLNNIMKLQPRIEKIAVKDAKLRTFITQDDSRNELVSHVYDVTYGVVRNGVDTLVILDDSIVRGTTLRQSILSNLGRLEPRKIIIVSSAPQIRYPDCYGIDMSKMNDFVAFRAAVRLHQQAGNEDVLDVIYEECKFQNNLPNDKIENTVKALYKPFSVEEISAKIAEIVKPKNINSEVQVIYQSLEHLHQACPGHRGDWYFSGNYPTPGGNRVVNKAFINYMENKNVRAY